MLSINIDGASRGNPGPSGIGICITKEDIQILSYGEFIGCQTNMKSEYLALKRALQLATAIDKDIIVFSDCLAVIKQRKLKTRIRNKGLSILIREISNLEKKFKNVSYMFISRKRNGYVDRLANMAIDDYFNMDKFFLYNRQL